MPDFLTRIAPWTVVKTGDALLALGARTAALVPTVAAGMQRWILTFSVGNRTGTNRTSVELQYGPGFLPLCRALGWVPGITIPINKLITTTPNELYIYNADGGVAAEGFPYTIIYADTPPNVLSNFVAGQYAG